MLKARGLVLTAALLSNVSVGNAALLDWTINGVTFDDGATASGSFTIDTDLNKIVDFDIATTAGTKITSPFEYTPSTADIPEQANDPGSGWPSDFVHFVSLKDVVPGGSRDLLLAFAQPLAPGVPVGILYEGGLGATSYENEIVGEHGPGARLIVGPQVVDPVPAPEPATLVGVGLGLSLLAGTILRARRGPQSDVGR